MSYECMTFFIVVIGFEMSSGVPKSVEEILRCGKVKRKVLYIEMCF